MTEQLTFPGMAKRKHFCCGFISHAVVPPRTWWTCGCKWGDARNLEFEKIERAQANMTHEEIEKIAWP